MRTRTEKYIVIACDGWHCQFVDTLDAAKTEALAVSDATDCDAGIYYTADYNGRHEPRVLPLHWTCVCSHGPDTMSTGWHIRTSECRYGR